MGQIGFYRRYSTERKCFNALRGHLYRGGQVKCPACGSARSWRYERANGCREYVCKRCRRKWSDLTGTIFERSRTPLVKWFAAIYEMANSPGISARCLMTRLWVTYKTAWRILKRIREALHHHLVSTILKGIVEVDETYYGGRWKGKRGRGAGGKTPIVGMVERGGAAVARAVPDASAESIRRTLAHHVDGDALLITDE